MSSWNFNVPDVLYVLAHFGDDRKTALRRRKTSRTAEKDDKDDRRPKYIELSISSKNLANLVNV